MSRTARLAELKALRASGKTRLSTYKVEEEEKLYEEVDEEGYKKVVRDRLDQDDFVIDDNGEGYADDGREEWMGEKRYDSASGSEEELPLKGKAGKILLKTLLLNPLICIQPKGSAKKTEKRLRRPTTASTSISVMDLFLPCRSSRYANDSEDLSA